MTRSILCPMFDEILYNIIPYYFGFFNSIILCYFEMPLEAGRRRSRSLAKSGQDISFLRKFNVFY